MSGQIRKANSYQWEELVCKTTFKKLLLIDSTILYVKLITFHRLYDKLSTNIQRQLSQYEKNPANMEKLSQYEIQPIRCENYVGLI